MKDPRLRGLGELERPVARRASALESLALGLLSALFSLRMPRVLKRRRLQTNGGRFPMPPRGVKKGTKRARQYEHVKSSARRRGESTARAKEIAARTVQKERARSGE